MVCCTIIAAFLALLLKPLMVLKTNPLTWRMSEDLVSPSLGAGKAANRWESFSYAFAGWRFLIRNEPNMRIHLAIAALVTIAGVLLEISATDWRWIVSAIAAVFVAEALNTAVEQACNALSHDFNPAIKAAKDVAAGAVLISALAAALIGASVFLPYMNLADTAVSPPLIHSICSGSR